MITVMSKSGNPSPPLIMERLGKLNQSDRSFDVEFWQRQGSSAIFAAAWEMLVEANQWKKKSDSELAFQRTVESLKSLRKPARKTPSAFSGLNVALKKIT